MDVLKKITLKNLKLNKKRSIMTIVGILLSTALICAVAGMGLSAKKTATEMVKYENGDFHIIFYDLPKSCLSPVRNSVAMSDICVYKNMGVARIGEINPESTVYDYMQFLSVEGFDDKAFDMLSVHLSSGRLPENDSEILLSERYIMNSDVKYKVGDTIELELGDRYDEDGNYIVPHKGLYTNEEQFYYDDEISEEDGLDSEVSDGEDAGLKTESDVKMSVDSKLNDKKEEKPQKLEVKETLENLRKKSYTVVGIIKRPTKFVENYNSAAFVAITRNNDSSEEGNYTIATKLKDPKKYKQYLGSLALTMMQLMKKTENNVDTDFNASYLGLCGAIPDKTSTVLYSMIAIIVSIIMVTSIFVIRNSFSISVQEKTRQYGMLASIGATTKQIRKSVLHEGLILGMIGVPLGMILGTAAILILVMILNALLGNLLDGSRFVYSLSPSVYIITILVSALTIFFSTLIPAIRASKIAPVEAIRNNNDIVVSSKKVKSPGYVKNLFGIGGVIADKNLRRSRKKYRTTITSLVLSISVFIGLSSFVGYMKKEMDLNLGVQDYNISVRSEKGDSEEKAKDYRNLVSALGLTDYSWPVSCIAPKSDMSAYYSEYAKQWVDEQNRVYQEIIEDGSYDGEIKEASIQPGLIMLSADYFEKYARAVGIKSDFDKAAILVDVVKQWESNGDTTVVHNYDISSGTSIRMGLEKWNQIEISKYESEYYYKDVVISCVSEKSPRGYEDVYSDGGYIFVSENYFTEEEKKQFDTYVDSLYIMSDNADNTEKSIKDLRDSDPSYGGMTIYNMEAETKNARNLLLALEIFLYGFITVITLIGVTNIFNTISTNMALRASEFAMLRSVGMTGKEFNRMIRLESIMYGSRSLAFGLPIGVLLSLLFYKVLGSSMDVGFIFPGKAILISVFAVFIIVWITMSYSVGKIKNQNIIETIRNENT